MADKKDDADEDKEAAGEAAAEGAAEGDESAAKKKKKKKMMMMAIAAAVLLAASGAGVYFSGILSKPKIETTTKKGKKKKEGGEEKGKEGGEHTTGSSVKAVKSNPNEWVPGVAPGHEGDDIAYYNLPEFLVNLDTSSKQTSFIKMKITLESESENDSTDAIDNRLPRIIDSFNTYLRTLRTSDIAGSAGLYRLREELLLRVNKTIYPGKINDVLFREIIIQ